MLGRLGSYRDHLRWRRWLHGVLLITCVSLAAAGCGETDSRSEMAVESSSAAHQPKGSAGQNSSKRRSTIRSEGLPSSPPSYFERVSGNATLAITGSATLSNRLIQVKYQVRHRAGPRPVGIRVFAKRPGGAAAGLLTFVRLNQAQSQHGTTTIPVPPGGPGWVVVTLFPYDSRTVQLGTFESTIHTPHIPLSSLLAKRP